METMHPGGTAVPVRMGDLPASPARVAVVSLCGPLDLEGARDLVGRALPLLRSSSALIVNLEAIDYVDSEGVRGLMLLATSARAHERPLALVVPAGSRAERTLRLLRMDGCLPLYATLADAWEQHHVL